MHRAHTLSLPLYQFMVMFSVEQTRAMAFLWTCRRSFARSMAMTPVHECAGSSTCADAVSGTDKGAGTKKKKKTSTSTANRHRYSYSHMYRYRYRRKQRRTCRAAHSGQVEALNVLPHLEPVHNLHRKVRHSHSRFFRRIQSHPTDRQREIETYH